MPPSRRGFLASFALAAAQGRPGIWPVVVELFTSQGCSSCPAADEVLRGVSRGELVPGVPVIALSQHVDYWNHIGWRDPFSSAAFSERQRRYSEAFGRDGLYTPQMVVDGTTEFVGSDAGRAKAAIVAGAGRPKAVVRLEWGKTIKIEIEPLPSGGESADVYLALSEDGLATQVARGENAGRLLKNDGVVRAWTRLGVWAPERKYTAEFTPKLDPAWERDRLSAVVVAQRQRSRRIVAAGSLQVGRGQEL